MLPCPADMLWFAFSTKENKLADHPASYCSRLSANYTCCLRSRPWQAPETLLQGERQTERSVRLRQGASCCKGPLLLHAVAVSGARAPAAAPAAARAAAPDAHTRHACLENVLCHSFEAMCISPCVKTPLL